MKSTIFLGQPPDTHPEIPHATGIKARHIPSPYLVIVLLLEAWRDETSRGRGVGRKSMQTEVANWGCGLVVVQYAESPHPFQ